MQDASAGARTAPVIRSETDDRGGATPLSAHTTLRLGGPAARLVRATSDEEILRTVRGCARSGDPLLVLGGGSNVVVSDAGFPGTALLLRTRGWQVTPDGGPQAATGLLTVAAGEPWDEVVAGVVEQGWAGLECLSGIPGSAGATPVQNVGAYGQEVAELITSVRVYDRAAGQVLRLAARHCGFGYRTSVFKHSDRWVVLGVEFRLRRSALSGPVRYPELARALGVAPGEPAPLAEVRAAVLKLRAGKGMVLDPDDPDTWSVGSFFTNPVLDPAGHAELLARAVGLATAPPSWPVGDGRIKVSAAWLIERAGFGKGHGGPAVAVSGKHCLALTNRGGGSTAELLELAAEIRAGVRSRFGVTMHPEPVLVGCALPDR